ncbi:2-dehydro-3-deoxy-D-gluconate 5-dehydrogenase KduD [Actinoplanes oblitus]|uniref:2-dehydro-3-deoxy-D-gluconate 5-dehydrogenase KduD n=1 Tax=Actinoplanes oblitus TaxID=3040509 RepID=A0ABY8WPP5_9ACTN|nr:2-dehydro-3-deoxy-D-gluconate 5-dehydrogenase KduD [Actinoplanes oblitus]WIM98533.1 2-dehydro-3-deoxy-D-gluconate 5-dehydrogenase KduD [Actinoplanes oblitus]
MVLDAFRLDGKVALVTGGNRGIGQAVAGALAAAGATVAVLARSRPVDEPPGTSAPSGRAAPLWIEADLASFPAAAVIDQVVDSLGRIDILVNNAGIIRRADAVDTTAEDWADVLRVDLDAVFRLSQAAGRVMLARGRGSIINIASLLSFQGGIRVPAYAAAKHGVVGLTKALANEWAAGGVNVNAIAPGYIATDNTAALRADEQRNAAILDRIPAGRWGTPDDLTGAAIFLASDAARYVHGAVIPVDGGWLAR